MPEEDEQTVEERLDALEAENRELRDRLDGQARPRTLRESRRQAREKFERGFDPDGAAVRRRRRNMEGAGDE